MAFSTVWCELAVEPLNLTLRQGVALLTRRTWRMTQPHSELTLPVKWGRAYYPFARYPEALQVERRAARPRKGQQSACAYRPQTPAMAAGLTARRGSTLELISRPV